MNFYTLEVHNEENYETDYFYFKNFENAVKFAKELVEFDIEAFQKRHPNHKRTWEYKALDIPSCRFAAYCVQIQKSIVIFDSSFSD